MRRALVALPVAVLALVAGPAGAHLEIEVLERAAADEVAERPEDPEVRVRQAQVYRAAGEWDEALAALEHAAEHGADPDLVAAERGRVFLDAGRPRAAKIQFDRVLRRRPDAFGVLLQRGRAWVQLGHPGRAARDLGAAVAGMPRPAPEDVFAWRDALVAAGRREDALRALDRGIARLGRVPSLALAALDLEVALGRHQAALARLDRLLAESPRNEAWLARRGELLERAGRRDEARGAYARALELIATRPAERRGKRIEALEHRLRTALAETGTPTEGKP